MSIKPPRITIPLMVTAGGWLIVTGIWYGVGGFAEHGFPGMAVYLGVCILGGTLSGRFL